jgi:hypothetical protein
MCWTDPKSSKKYHLLLQYLFLERAVILLRGLVTKNRIGPEDMEKWFIFCQSNWVLTWSDAFVLIPDFIFFFFFLDFPPSLSELESELSETLMFPSFFLLYLAESDSNSPF